MKKKLFGAIALVAMLAAPALAEAATRGFATANVNMRSGPSTAYPAVVVIPNGAPLTVHGCLSDTPWCDVSFVGGRGWVAGRYIATTYRQNRVYVEPRYYRDLGVPVITFEVGRYWDRYYRDRDFYRERDRWRRPPPSGGYWNAPPPRADWDRPRPRDDWRDGRRDDWRDGRRDEWRDPRQGGPNDGRWVAGRYIATTYRQNRVYVEPRYYRDLGVPVITFEVGRYWDRYYRDRDFYRERDRWRRPPPSGGYWNAPPPRADWDRPRPRDDWRDGRRDDWRDGRRDEWRDPRQGGPNDGRWERRYGDWNQGDRNQDRPRREDDRRRWEDENRDRNRQFNQDDGQRRPERRVQPEEQRRPEGRAPAQEQVRPPEPAPRSYRACDPADTECLSRQ